MRRRMIMFLVFILATSIIGCKDRDENELTYSEQLLLESEDELIEDESSDIDLMDIIPKDKRDEGVKEDEKKPIIDSDDNTDKPTEQDKSETIDKEETSKETQAERIKSAEQGMVEVNKDMWVTANVNFRVEPHTDCDTITSLQKGKKVFAISKLTNNWYKIKTDNKEGYVSGNYLSNTEPTKEIAKVEEPKKDTPKKEPEKPKTEQPKEEPKKEPEKPKAEEPKENESTGEIVGEIGSVIIIDTDDPDMQKVAETLVVLDLEVKPRTPNSSEPITFIPHFINNGGGIINPEVVIDNSVGGPEGQGQWVKYNKGDTYTVTEPGRWSMAMRCTVEVYNNVKVKTFDIHVITE